MIIDRVSFLFISYSFVFPFCFLFVLSREVEDFEILHGDPQGLPDTMAFLKSLADIGAGHDSKKDTDDEVREDLAAAGLFNWEVILAFL